MAAYSNLFHLTLLALLTTMPLFRATTSARSLNYNLIGSNANLEARLNLDEESSNWHGCCEAIRTIEHQCWPALLSTLGFTTEETDVLKGYCDETHHIQFPLSTPSPPVVDKPN
ncbi:unnamed protein product [Prunus armeniaca]|uniref:Prolamin-like domain-containing protein n=1 Tax=Prunus armeniaca TaxID=36596 RepID=A0A6J5Y5K9_PRUAR|nr:unnamed protein product [Prunus armeniaca]